MSCGNQDSQNNGYDDPLLNLPQPSEGFVEPFEKDLEGKSFKSTCSTPDRPDPRDLDLAGKRTENPLSLLSIQFGRQSEHSL